MKSLVLSLAFLASFATLSSTDFDAGMASHQNGDYATVSREFKSLAEMDVAKVQNILEIMYDKGQAVGQGNVRAHIWLNVAEAQLIKQPREASDQLAILASLPMNVAAISSAVAAFFAALSSFLIMLIQRRGLLESVRPELVLTGWSRLTRGEGDTACEVITFQSIKNVGRGAALYVSFSCMHEADNRPTAVLSSRRLPILATNEMTDFNGEISVFWKNVAPVQQGHKILFITIRIYYWDSGGMRHKTNYELWVGELRENIAANAEELAPGVALLNRTTVTKSVWSLKLRAKLAHFPGLAGLSHERT